MAKGKSSKETAQPLTAPPPAAATAKPVAIAEQAQPAPTDDFGAALKASLEQDITGGDQEAPQAPPAAQAPAATEPSSEQAADNGPETDLETELEPTPEVTEAEEEAEPKVTKDRTQKRIDQLVAERNAAREEAEALKVRLAEPQAPQPPVAAVPDAVEAQLQASVQKARGDIDWARAYKAGEEWAVKRANGREFTGAELDAIEEGAREDVTMGRMEIKQHQATRKQQLAASVQEAVAAHPWLKDQTNPDTVTVAATFREHGYLLQVPGALSVMADALAWRRHKAAVAAKPKPTAAAAPAAPIPRQPSAPAAAPPPQQPAANGSMKEFLETGDRSKAKKVVESWLS